MIATNEETLASLFEAAIGGISPRIVYKGAEGYKLYVQAKSAPTGTRRFRLLFSAGNVQPDGAMAGRIIEHFAELRVEVEYTGDHAKLQYVWIDDFHQIADTLAGLAASDNGVRTVIRQRVELMVGDENSNSVQVHHVYLVRYMRRVHL